MSTIKFPAAHLMGLITAIAGVAMYAARIEAQATDAQTRVAELKTDIDQIKADVRAHGVVLATLKNDGRHIIKALEKMQKRRRRR